MAKRGTHRGPNGVLVIDKPRGMTSHDVVNHVRRNLGVRRVGHAGTLDPMATGVLVVLVGEATKLAPYLSGQEKSYEAQIQLGSTTNTLDVEGEVTERAGLPPWWTDRRERQAKIRTALDLEAQRAMQVPPVYSAIKVRGRSAHARVRAGEALDLAARPVAVRSLALAGVSEEGRLSLELTVSKGYYVRSLARDLGRALGLPAYLCALRRTASGAFALERAAPLGAPLPTPICVTEAVRLAMPVVTLTASGCVRARQGVPMDRSDFTTPPSTGTSAWLDASGALVAIGEVTDGRAAVVRGFVATQG